ncbi:MAG: GAF domain-containing protein, partial [Mycobacteriales bacterium]
MRGQRDLTSFDIGAAAGLIADVRDLAAAASSVEGFTQSLCTLLHTRFVAEGQPQTALVRCYGTTTLEGLPDPERAYVQARCSGELTGTTTCLALLGTAGTAPAWNDRRRSAEHLVLPLVDQRQVAQMPMIAGLLQQLGVDVHALTSGQPDVMLTSEDGSCQVFYVREAWGSSLIPAQDFVRDHGIVSAIGFGGGLPTGAVFAIVMFCTVPVPPEAADLFELVALAVRLAALDLLSTPLFAGGRHREPALNDRNVLQSRLTLTQGLLTSYELIAAAQVTTIRTALARARYDAARATAMAAVAQGLTDVNSLQDVAGVLLREGSSAVGADALSIAIVDESATAVDVIVSGDIDDDIAREFARLPLDDRLPTTFTARTGRVVILEDISLVDHGFADLDAAAAATQMQSMACVPMWSGERLVGALTCGWHSTYSFDDSALELMVALAAQTSQALERWRLR